MGEKLVNVFCQYDSDSALKSITDKINSPHSECSSGFYEMDSICEGLPRRALVVLGARTAMGKTNFCLSLVRHVSLENKLPAAMYSATYSREALMQRLLLMDSDLSLSELTVEGQAQNYLEKLQNSAQRVKNGNLLFGSWSNLDFVKSQLMNEFSGRELGLIVIDDIQDILSYDSDPLGVAEERHFMLELKKLAFFFNCTVIAVSQLARRAEQRTRPELTDLYQMGTLEETADLVWLIYREAYYNLYAGDEAEIIIAKNKINGILGTNYLRFENRTGRFFDKISRY